jgi:hypothetical protein
MGAKSVISDEPIGPNSSQTTVFNVDSNLDRTNDLNKFATALVMPPENDKCARSTLEAHESIAAVPSLVNVMVVAMEFVGPPALTAPDPPNQPG